jgi:hypothetical protein
VHQHSLAVTLTVVTRNVTVAQPAIPAEATEFKFKLPVKSPQVERVRVGESASESAPDSESGPDD